MAFWVFVDLCKDGEIIAEDVILEDRKLPIITKDSILCEKSRSILKRFNVDMIKVKKESFSSYILSDEDMKQMESYFKLVSAYHQIFIDLAAGKDLDTGTFLMLTEEIIQQDDRILKCIEAIHQINGSDAYTYKHSVNVSIYAMFIGKWLGLNKEEIIQLVHAGLLHDIGKSRVPQDILMKNTGLTDEEFKVISQHPVIGYEICHSSEEISDIVKEAVLGHHEREDGSGYPNSQHGSMIHTITKILSIADVYDALTSERIYKAGLTPFEAYEVMISEAYEGRIELKILNSFFKRIIPYYIGATVLLNNNEKGVVVFVPPNQVDKPIVQVNKKFVDLAFDDVTITKVLKQS